MSIGEFLQSFTSGQSLAILGAGLAVILPGIGSTRGVGIVGESVTGLVAEDPSKFGLALVLQLIPSTQGLYGFVVAAMIFLQMGVFGGELVELTLMQGGYFLAASIPVAVVAFFSPVSQARVCVSGINMISKRPDQLAKAIITASLLELYVILAMVVSIILVIRV